VAAWSNTTDDINWSVRETDGTWSDIRSCSSADPDSCETVHPPATAVLSGRTNAYMVAWMAGEMTQYSLDVLRFEIIDRDTGAVLADETYGWHFDHYSRSMGVGSNPDNHEFIVAALAEYNVLALQSFTTDGTQTRYRRYLWEGDTRPHQIGDPVCTESQGRGQMRCVLPVTTEGVDGMCAGYLEFTHGPQGFQSFTELHEDCDVRISGRPSFAAGWEKGTYTGYLLAGAQPWVGEHTNMYGLWSITDPMGAVAGSHTAATNPGPANRFRSVGSLIDGYNTQWIVADSHQAP
jgi:hypothetical protein